jgi:hypothetical protein
MKNVPLSENKVLSLSSLCLSTAINQGKIANVTAHWLVLLIFRLPMPSPTSFPSTSGGQLFEMTCNKLRRSAYPVVDGWLLRDPRCLQIFPGVASATERKIGIAPLSSFHLFAEKM